MHVTGKVMILVNLRIPLLYLVASGTSEWALAANNQTVCLSSAEARADLWRGMWRYGAGQDARRAETGCCGPAQGRRCLPVSFACLLSSYSNYFGSVRCAGCWSPKLTLPPHLFLKQHSTIMGISVAEATKYNNVIIRFTEILSHAITFTLPVTHHTEPWSQTNALL